MKGLRASDHHIGGMAAILAGLVGVAEGIRLSAASEGGSVGDHTMPLIVGGMLAGLGLLLVLFGRPAPPSEEARGTVRARKKLFACMACLFSYSWLIPVLGYAAATWLASAALFAIVGDCSWGRSCVYAAALTAVFYVALVEWLHTPLPAGLFI